MGCTLPLLSAARERRSERPRLLASQSISQCCQEWSPLGSVRPEEEGSWKTEIRKTGLAAAAGLTDQMDVIMFL